MLHFVCELTCYRATDAFFLHNRTPLKFLNLDFFFEKGVLVLTLKNISSINIHEYN